MLALMTNDGGRPERALLSIACAEAITRSIVAGPSQTLIVARADSARVSGSCAPEVARGLLEAIDEHEHRWAPRTLLAVARAAERILDQSGRDVPQLRFRAIKEQASALRLLGDLEEAFRQTDRAAAAASGTEAREFNLALVAYCRAIVSYEAGRTCEASDLLRAAREVFARHHDTVRMERAVSFEASILYREKRYDEAAALYRGALMAATERGDVERAAAELGNLGHCATRKGDVRAARQYLDAAAEMYRNIGMPIPSARILRSLARIAFRESGRQSIFDDAAAAFDSLGMIGEWALTLLAHAEELKERDASTDVSRICMQVYVRASKAGMVVTAAEALEMLADCGRSTQATADTVRTVAASIDAAAMESQVFAVN